MDEKKEGEEGPVSSHPKDAAFPGLIQINSNVKVLKAFEEEAGLMEAMRDWPLNFGKKRGWHIGRYRIWLTRKGELDYGLRWGKIALQRAYRRIDSLQGIEIDGTWATARSPLPNDDENLRKTAFVTYRWWRFNLTVYSKDFIE
jgi:hypothetical protein